MKKLVLILMVGSLFIGCATKGGATLGCSTKSCLTKGCATKGCSKKSCATKGCSKSCCANKTPNNAESLEPVNPIETQNAKDISIHQVVEAACGQCQFGMTDKLGCDLAVRIDGETYFVDGTKIDEHGDAHADDGFCVVIRNANVKGKIVDGRFKSESFTLTK